MIERVLVNLITNAILALENRLEQKKIYIEILELNNRILIKVEDNGAGIDEKMPIKSSFRSLLPDLMALE